jgi:hypothetical protein
MNTNLTSQVHFFETLRDTIDSLPYASLCFEEMNSLIDQVEKLVKYLKVPDPGLDAVYALRRAVENARSDGYFPIVILPARKYEAALVLLRDNPPGPACPSF